MKTLLILSAILIVAFMVIVVMLLKHISDLEKDVAYYKREYKKQYAKNRIQNKSKFVKKNK